MTKKQVKAVDKVKEIVSRQPEPLTDEKLQEFHRLMGNFSFNDHEKQKEREAVFAVNTKLIENHNKLPWWKRWLNVDKVKEQVTRNWKRIE